MPKRRDHGQGALYELKSRGLWRGVVDGGFTPDGRRRQRYVHAKSREECVRKLRQLMQEIATGGALDHHTRVADLAERWLQDASGRLKPKTVQAYRSNVTTNVVPVLGKTIVSDLRPSHVRRLHVEVFSRGVGPATVAAAHRTLSAMLSYAVDEGLIARNVAESVDIPRQAPSERDSLTRAETQALLALGDPQWSLALLSGARDGEIRALRRSDVDLEAGRLTISWTMAEAAFKHGCGGTCGRGRSADCPSRTIDVAASLQTEPLEGRWVLVRPKAYKPRTVPLTPETVTALRKLIDADLGRNPHGLLWHKPNGQPLSNTDSNTRLRAALKAAGIHREATVHWLRHTYTTMAEHAGIEWVVSAGISGHASEGISRRYTHQLEQEARNGIERLNRYLQTPSTAGRSAAGFGPAFVGAARKYERCRVRGQFPDDGCTLRRPGKDPLPGGGTRPLALHLGSLTPLQSLGVPVSLVGSVFLAAGAELQHAGVRSSAQRSLQEGRKLASVLRLVRTPVWLLGTSLLGLAILFQLVSLTLAPLTVVQPLGAVALVITALVNARVTHARLDRKAVRAIVLCVAGIGLFVGTAAATTSSRPILDAQLIAVLIILAVVLLAAGVSFALARARLGTIGYIAGAGILFGFVATLAKVIIDRVHTVIASGSGFTSTDWLTATCLLGLAVAGGFGLYLVQKAYAIGPPDLVVAGLTVIDPMIGVTIGIAVLGEATTAPVWAIPVFAIAGAIAVFGVIQLARHPAKVALRPGIAARTGAPPA